MVKTAVLVVEGTIEEEADVDIELVGPDVVAEEGSAGIKVNVVFS